MSCFHLNNHFKIWFSNDKHIFLDDENQFRLVTMRANNRHANIHFIYSSKCLTKASVSDLKRFCLKHRIVPVDFDKEIPLLLKTPRDKKLYALAKQEIYFSQKNQGGNMAGGSDCARMLLAVIEKYGIYTDFDVVVTLPKKPQIITHRSPILVNGHPVPDELVLPNNDIIAVARVDEKKTTLSPRAIQCLEFVQDEMIKRYQDPFEALAVLPILGITVKHFADKDLCRIIHFLNQKNPKADVFAWRRNVEKFSPVEYILAMSRKKRLEIIGTKDVTNMSMTEAEEDLGAFIVKKVYPTADLQQISKEILKQVVELAIGTLKITLTKQLVTSISGPYNLYALYKDRTKDFTYKNPDEKVSWNKIEKLFNDTCISVAVGENVFCSTNLSNMQGANGDESWHALGVQKKQERIQAMHEAARTIQAAWYHYKAKTKKRSPLQKLGSYFDEHCIRRSRRLQNS